MVRPGHGLILAGLLLAGCATLPAETPEQAQARRAADCTTAGFTPDSDAYRLCLMIQQQNERLAVMENRLRFVEGQSFGPIGPYWSPWW
ncbi:MAG: hypothetical protein U1E14_11765 [Geminicoccaceae bacterium]